MQWFFSLIVCKSVNESDTFKLKAYQDMPRNP